MGEIGRMVEPENGWKHSGAGRWPAVLGKDSVEDGARGAGPLELEESRGAGHQHPAVPEPAGSFTPGRRRDDRTEERGPTHGDHGRTHLLADQCDGAGVAGPHSVVDLVR